jgi:hypothetical protein
LRVARAEHFATTAGQQILVFVTAATIQHQKPAFLKSRWGFSSEMDPFCVGSASISSGNATAADLDVPHGHRRLLVPIKG